MSNETPQLENGFTKIANELLEAILLAEFSKREFKILLAMIRQTYGYRKSEDDISLSRLSVLTGLDTGNISKTITGLVGREVLLKRQGRHGHVIGIQKNYRLWRGCQNNKVVKTTIGGCQNNNTGVVKTTTTKENPTKETKQKGENRNSRNSQFELSGFDLQVLDAWKKHCPTLSQPNRRLWNQSQAKIALDKIIKLDPEKHSKPEMWEWMFSFIRTNSHWMGKNDTSWSISIPWILDPAAKFKRFMQVLDYARNQHSAKTAQIGAGQ